MEEKDIKRYVSYKKALGKNRTNWVDRIRFWKILKKDLENNQKEIIRKQDRIQELKKELDKTKLGLSVALQQIEQLSNDLKKKNTRKKKEVK